MNKGITIAGNILVDAVKIIDVYPECGMLANIKKESKAVGGCVPNTAINLAKIDNTVSLTALGMVGNDDNGRFVVGEMAKYGIDVSKIITDSAEKTSYSDVMTCEKNGSRTFFHSRGANKKFAPENIDIAKLETDIFHIGYILLLDKFDEDDEIYGTKTAKLLSEIQKRNIKTSIDAVSDMNGQFAKKIIPALKYCNFAIMNEIESCGVVNLPARDGNGKLIINNIIKTMEKFFLFGVKDTVIIHCPEAGFIMDSKGNYKAVPSLELPKDFIKGSVGAGDSFCAASLYGLYSGMNLSEILEFASSAAACNLSESDSISGMLDKKGILEMSKKFGRKQL